MLSDNCEAGGRRKYCIDARSLDRAPRNHQISQAESCESVHHGRVAVDFVAVWYRRLVDPLFAIDTCQTFLPVVL